MGEQTTAPTPAKKPGRKVDIAGAMIEATIDAIDEGAFRKELDQALRAGHRELERYAEETGDRTGSVTITASISLNLPKDLDDHVHITTSVNKKLPVRKRGTLVKSKGGRMLCQPSGSSAESPDQQVLFDARGVCIGTVDKSTGELIEDDDETRAVAGEIKPGA